MACWDRVRSTFVAVFEEHEIDVLRMCAEAVLALLDRRAASYSATVVHGREVMWFPDRATTDPALVAILRRGCGGDGPDWMLAWEEAAHLDFVGGTLRRWEQTLPVNGGHVQLSTFEDAIDWLLVLDLYLVSLHLMVGDLEILRLLDPVSMRGWLKDLRHDLSRVVNGAVGPDRRVR